MTEQNNKKISLGEFEDEIRQAIHYLKTDIYAVARLIGAAKEYGNDVEIEIRREIRPLAVELLYQVIGTPKTFEEVLSEMNEQEDEDDN